MEDRERLVLEGQRLRDYLIRTSDDGKDELTAALHPFERSGEEPTEADHLKLVAAFRSARRRALSMCDDHTLGQVLSGRSPFEALSSFGAHSFRVALTTAAFTAFGALLVFLALHFTYWSNQAAFTVAEIEQVEEFDYVDYAMRAVELQNVLRSSITDADETDLEPFRLYAESLSALGGHFTTQQYIPSRIRQLDVDFVPFRGSYEMAARNRCAIEADQTSVKVWGVFETACVRRPSQAAQQSDQDDEGENEEGAADDAKDDEVAQSQSQDDSAIEETLASTGESEASKLQGDATTEPAAVQTTAYQAYIDDMRQALVSFLKDAGRQDAEMVLISDPLQVSVTGKAEVLREKLNIVHRWALPVIYGALGSIVYLMWRVLSPPIAPLGFLHGVLRTSFAALAALTLSMLFIPSNTLGLGTEVSRPLIYLISFVFGYSIEAFVGTLNNLNRALTSRLTPKEAEAAKT